MTSNNMERYQEELGKIKSAQFLLWRKQYGVEGKFQLTTFDNFTVALQPKAFEAVKNSAGKSLVLSSPPGVYGIGKTHLVCALANLMVETGETAFLDEIGLIGRNICPVHYTSEVTLLPLIRATYHKGSDKTDIDIFDELSRYTLLIIDDIGKNRPRDLSFLQDVYYRIINDRDVSQRQLIITTNLEYDELEEYIGGASADRLRGMCGKEGFIKMTGESQRK